MSIPGSASPLLLASTAAAAGGYQVSRSLRFNSADSANLSRTPAVAGNRRTWTWAGWVKRSGLSTRQPLIISNDGGTANYTEVFFNTDDTIRVLHYTSNVKQLDRSTTAVFRDVSSFYHIVVAFDMTQATAANRQRVYVNGIEITSFTNTTTLAQNSDTWINATRAHYIFRQDALNSYGNGYLAECYLIDGQQLTPSSFTEVSATTGQLIPLAYSGSFGTNGFWLKFSDNSAATAATLGKDYSGNSNNWTPNNLSVTAGAGNDSLVDTPTSYGTDTGVGGEVRGNYATLNPLDSKLSDNGTISNGNLQYAQSSTGARTGRASIGVLSGKWYWELTADNSGNSNVGVTNSLSNLGTYVGADANGWGYVASGSKSNNGETAYGSSWTSGDIIGVALNMDAGTITFYKNNVSQGTAFSGLSGTLFPSVGTSNISTCSFTINFGQRAFAYPLSGFKALCDTNLPAPLTAKPNTVMDVKLYTGNGSTQTISGLGFSPDWVWLKSRSGAFNHALFDTIRTAGYQINSNLTDAETLDATKLSAFTSDGFTLGSAGGTNGSGSTFAAWCWDAGTSTVTNTAGSITSQVRANVSAGFSVVTYTGSVSGSTVGHGLGVAPAFIIGKRRDGASEWSCYHQSLGNAQQIVLNTTAAGGSSSAWNSTSPTSSVISLGAAFSINFPSYTHVLYCFAPVVGYSNFGSYTGNGLAEGPFVYTGFRPKWILIKSSSSAASWVIYDSLRNGYNQNNPMLFPDLSNADYSITGYFEADILSSGFKIRNIGSGTNSSGTTYIYYAVAENPFQYARAR